MSVEIITGPAIEPVTLEEAKTHLRVTGFNEDDYIADLVSMCRLHIETITSRRLISQVLNYYLDEFPNNYTSIELPVAPISSIASIAYIDTAGNVQTWSSSEYDVDLKSTPCRILPGLNKIYPTTKDIFNAVTIQFVAGYGANTSDVPRTIKHAIKLLLGNYYENREEVTSNLTGVSFERLPLGIRSLLFNYVVR